MSSSNISSISSYEGNFYDPEWDVTMGSFDSAEVADLVSLFLLSRIEHLPVKSGIFKDDGICLSDLSADETE